MATDVCILLLSTIVFWPKHLKNFVIPVALQIAEGNKGMERSSNLVVELGVDFGSCAWCQSVVTHIHSSLWCAFPQPCCDTKFFGVCEWSSVSTERWARNGHKAETSDTKVVSVRKSFQCFGFCASWAASSLLWQQYMKNPLYCLEKGLPWTSHFSICLTYARFRKVKSLLKCQ